MITSYISAGSSSIVQDLISECVSLSPIANWQGCFYQSTTGSQPWTVWAQRMDDAAHELQYVYSRGMANPPDSYELITVPMPSLSGFSMSFEQRGSPPQIVQSGKGSGAGTNVSFGSLPVIRGRISAAVQKTVTFNVGGPGGFGDPTHNITGAQCVSDLWTIAKFTRPQGNPQISSYFYNSSTGSQDWAAYIIIHNMTETTGAVPGELGSPQVAFFYTMGGMAAPPSGSENRAIPCPLSTLQAINSFNSLYFKQISEPLTVFTQ